MTTVGDVDRTVADAALAPPLVYCLDAEDRICQLNDAYVHDVAQHGPLGQAPDALLGKLL